MTLRFKQTLIVLLIPAFAFLDFTFSSDDIITLIMQLPCYSLLYILNPLGFNLSGSDRIVTGTLMILPDSFLESDNWANIGASDTFSTIMMICWVLALAFAIISLVFNFLEKYEIAGMTLIFVGVAFAIIQFLAFVDDQSIYSSDWLPIPLGWIGCLIVGWWIYQRKH